MGICCISRLRFDCEVSIPLGTSHPYAGVTILILRCSLCISSWAGGAALLSLGLNITQTVGVMIIARVLIFFLVTANGWMGSEWHIGFTVSQRFVGCVRGARGHTESKQNHSRRLRLLYWHAYTHPSVDYLVRVSGLARRTLCVCDSEQLEPQLSDHAQHLSRECPYGHSRLHWFCHFPHHLCPLHGGFVPTPPAIIDF
jgi:hypothetical protein